MSVGGRGVLIPTGSAGGMIFVGNLVKGLFGIADGPGGVVKIRCCSGWIGGDADPPSLVEQERRT